MNKKIIITVCLILISGLIIYKMTRPDPLYVVDGVIVNKEQFESYKPEEIEHTNIFKDGAATVIYGEKGKNGVILITLKQKKEIKIKTLN